jgi:hypothetical protein
MRLALLVPASSDLRVWGARGDGRNPSYCSTKTIALDIDSRLFTKAVTVGADSPPIMGERLARRALWRPAEATG